MMRPTRFALACAPLCLVACAAGCSSQPVEISLSSPPTGPRVAAATAASPHRSSRPIPEVIPRSKPFRLQQMPQASAAAGSTTALLAHVDGPAASRVTAASAVEQFRPTASESVRGPAAADIAGIRDMLASYLRAFNRHDPAALAAHWSTAGENVDLDSGEATVGREAVREVFTALFTEDANATIDIDVAAIRPVRPDVAVVDGVSRISFTDTPPSSSRFSAVLVRQDGNWMLDSVRESHAPVAARPESPANPLDELGWLVGSWEDVSEGVTASTHCFWSANKAFLVRSHVVSADSMSDRRPQPGDASIPGLLPTGTPAGRGTTEITEIIGWDPERGQIRSWLFTSDGRFAEGSWSRADATETTRSSSDPSWMVRMEGRGGDLAADCTFELVRVGDDGLECRCGSDALAAVVPPACEYVRTARAADAAPAR